MFPINLTLVITAFITNLITLPFQKKITCENPKNILLTGGKMTKYNLRGHFIAEDIKYLW
jgi:hypothetical protein